MTSCPKCAGLLISGPIYRDLSMTGGFDPGRFSTTVKREWLEYRCLTCGYKTRTDTLDSKEKKEGVGRCQESR